MEKKEEGELSKTKKINEKEEEEVEGGGGYFRETQKKEEFTIEEGREYNKNEETFRRSFEYW